MSVTAIKEATRLKGIYNTIVAPRLKEQFKYENIHQIPRLTKVVINRGVGEAGANAKALDISLKEIGIITGQQPVITRAKKAIASFKVRAGMPVGIMVTLRADKMYEFMDRLMNIALPRIRDFRGVNPKSFDGRGNCTLGLKEQLLFPEISYESVDKMRGMDIIICTTAPNDEEGRALLTELGMPFRKP
ncbi:50S ribosomal protein L5 [Candidatus Cyanaurora vandensis]|uniref:50S ribosomal protein L5 n=1 Tax=Candidatus Cyanaurora vandensis TaxID=2714958 RepID=UPI002580D914|nr:50S ribosomal protein L5 [Candidatus Cyanaurora vandensis]